jgi:hypothetical protein
LEIADIYKVSKLKLIQRGEERATTAPWHDVPPPLAVYRERGHRRLSIMKLKQHCDEWIANREKETSEKGPQYFNGPNARLMTFRDPRTRHSGRRESGRYSRFG